MPSRPSRSYGDPCGIARALDLVGDRWALLVVRDLLLGPKRFSQLRRGLHDASPNVLSQRLRDLEDAGIVHRYTMGPPAGVPVYELTERGQALEPILIELGRWGSTAPQSSGAELRSDALMIALKTTFDPGRAGDLRSVHDLRLTDDRFRVAVADGRLQVSRRPVDQPDATVITDGPTLRSVAFGRQVLAEAEHSGSLAISGDRDSVARLLGAFAHPNRRGAADPAGNTLGI